MKFIFLVGQIEHRRNNYDLIFVFVYVFNDTNEFIVRDKIIIVLSILYSICST